MKFDADRAMDLTRRLDFPRHAGTEGERRAADLVAGAFERAGLRVGRHAIPGRSTRLPRDTVLWVGLGLWFWFVIGRVIPDTFPTSRAVGAMSTALSLLAAFWLRRRPGRGSSGPSQDVIGTRPPEGSTPARVLFLTHLDTPPPHRVVLVRRGVLTLFATLAVILVAPGFLVGLRPVVGSAVLVGQWLSIILWIVAPRIGTRDPFPADNRSGLAVLAELACTWTGDAQGRIETWFVAIGSDASEQGGLWGWIRPVAPQWPAKPTLVIHLDAPGLGPVVRLGGRGEALSLAATAAEDLWLPHRISSRIPTVPGLRPFARLGLPGVGLGGDRRATRIEPALLAATAHLAIEIALRWARQHREAAQDDSLARSSQKPG
jgi:hypothetical protein